MCSSESIPVVTANLANDTVASVTFAKGLLGAVDREWGDPDSDITDVTGAFSGTLDAATGRQPEVGAEFAIAGVLVIIGVNLLVALVRFTPCRFVARVTFVARSSWIEPAPRCGTARRP